MECPIWAIECLNGEPVCEPDRQSYQDEARQDGEEEGGSLCNEAPESPSLLNCKYFNGKSYGVDIQK